MKIEIEVKSVYGNELYYPACKHAEAFARIANSKTLTAQTLRQISQLGYEVVIAQPNINFGRAVI